MVSNDSLRSEDTLRSIAPFRIHGNAIYLFNQKHFLSISSKLSSGSSQLFRKGSSRENFPPYIFFQLSVTHLIYERNVRKQQVKIHVHLLTRNYDFFPNLVFSSGTDKDKFILFLD